MPDRKLHTISRPLHAIHVRNAIDEQLVQFFPCRLQFLRRLLSRNVRRQLRNVQFPVRFLNGLVFGESVAFLHMTGLQHEQGPPEIATGLAGNVNC